MNEVFMPGGFWRYKKAMIPELGHFALILALFMAGAQIVPLLCRQAAVLQFVLSIIAFMALLWSAVTLDFTVTTVAENAHTLKPFIQNVIDVVISLPGLIVVLALVFSSAGFMLALKRPNPFLLRGFGIAGAALLLCALFYAPPFARIYPPPFDGVGYDPFGGAAAEASIVGQPLPSFTAGALAAEDIEGPAIINFYASWCPPCEAEHPVLQEIAQDGVRIYGINYMDSVKNAAAFLARLGNPYIKTGNDPLGCAAETFDIVGMPTSFVVDASGIIRYRHDAPLTNEDTATLKKYLQ